MKNLVFIVLVVIVFSCKNKTNYDDVKIQQNEVVDTSKEMVNYSEPEKIFWEVCNYVDEFGDETKEKYVRNSETILGTFSNSATQNSDLRVSLLINSKESINIQLYEYNGDNPVKAAGIDEYKIKVKSDSSDVIVLKSNNYSDRLKLEKNDSKKLSKLFSKGWKLKFSIIDMSEYSSSVYNFELEDTKGFDEAIKQLK